MNRIHLVSLIASLFAMFSTASANPLAVGADAPAVTATTESGSTLDLAEVYKKQPYTLVYFYPKADTPGCTAQGCSLRDSYAELTKKGVAVIGVSVDSPEAQKAFKEKYRLPFTLLADTDKKVMKAFGQSERPVAARQAYLVKDGKIVYANLKAPTEKQAEEILTYLSTAGS